MTQRLATAAGVGDREPGPDPRLDLVSGSIALRHGRIEFVHPRASVDLLYEQSFDDDEEYPPYWAELWPSGIELASAVSAQEPSGATVLELGCGLGLPSIAASLAGGRVLATDRSPDAIAFTTVNARRSGAVLETAVSSWVQPDLLVDRAPWDLVLASDLIYGQRNVLELIELLPRLVDGSGEVWITDPSRPLADEFLAMAREDWESVATSNTRLPTVQLHRLRGPRRAS